MGTGDKAADMTQQGYIFFEENTPMLKTNTISTLLRKLGVADGELKNWVGKRCFCGEVSSYGGRMRITVIQ
jgi:hypothetical protein